MDLSIVLNELERSRWIIGGYLLRDNTLVIVEPELISKGAYSDSIRYENLTHVRTAGYTVAVQLYTDFVTGKDYLLVLKDCGVLEVLDSDLIRLDMLDTMEGYVKSETFMVLDDRNQKLYINLKRNQIFGIQFKASSEEFTFLRGESNSRCIFESVENIVNMESSWHVDFESARDFIAISVLLFDDSSKKYYFQAIRQVQVERRQKERPWLSLVDKTFLELESSSLSQFNVSQRSATFKAVPNIGFFIFSLCYTFLFELPGGPTHTLAGKQIHHFAKYEVIPRLFDDNYHDEIEVYPNVVLHQTIDFLLFTAFTSTSSVINIKIDLVREDTDDFVYHWGQVVSARQSIPQLVSTATSREIAKIIPLNTALCMLLTETEGLVFLDMKSLVIRNRVPFQLRTAFYSGSVGENFIKHIVCGGSKGNKGFLDSRMIGYKDLLSAYLSLSSESAIMKMWSAEDSVWWKALNGAIYHNGQEVNQRPEVSHISLRNEIIDEKYIIAAVNIENDPEQGYCYLTDSGIIRWTDDNLSAPIKNCKSSMIVRYNLACFKDAEGSKLTVVAVDNVLTILRNGCIEIESLDVSHRLEAVSMLLIVPQLRPNHILLGDIDGRLFRVDLMNIKSLSVVKVGCGRVRMCTIPNSVNILVYTRDDLLLLAHNEFRLTRVDFPHTVIEICARNSKIIDVLIDDFHVISCEIHLETQEPTVIKNSIASKTHFHTKFVEIPFSTKYVVTSSFRSEYSSEYKRHIFNSEVQLHDLKSGKTLYRYDLTKRYRQAIISDIIAIPFQKGPNSSPEIYNQQSYAKRLTFSRCFIVSLHYETAEEDNALNDILVFSVDDGVIDFHLAIRTGHVITALHNYYQNLFLAAGDVLEVFEIDYSVKDNAFKVSPVSNKIGLSGFTKQLLIAEENQSDAPEHGQRGAQKFNMSSHRIVALNIFRGFQEFEIRCDYNKHPTGTSKDEYMVRVSPLPNSQRTTDFVEAVHGKIITSASVITNKNSSCFALSCTNNYVSIHRTNSKNVHDSIEFRLPSQVTSINSIRLNETHYNVALREHHSKIDAFVVTTCQGGCYFLQLSKYFAIKSELEQTLEEQHHLIGVIDDGIDFFDTRMLKMGEKQENVAKNVSCLSFINPYCL